MVGWASLVEGVPSEEYLVWLDSFIDDNVPCHPSFKAFPEIIALLYHLGRGLVSPEELLELILGQRCRSTELRLARDTHDVQNGSRTILSCHLQGFLRCAGVQLGTVEFATSEDLQSELVQCRLYILLVVHKVRIRFSSHMPIPLSMLQ